MEQTFLEWIIGQAGLAGIAALGLYLLNRTWAEANRRERESADIHRQDKLEMMKVLTEQTRVMARLEAAIDEWTHAGESFVKK